MKWETDSTILLVDNRHQFSIWDIRAPGGRKVCVRIVDLRQRSLTNFHFLVMYFAEFGAFNFRRVNQQGHAGFSV